MGKINMKKLFYTISGIFCFFLSFGFMGIVNADLQPQEYVNTPPTTPYTHVEFKERVSFNKKSLKLDDQSQEWQSKMRDLGHRLKQAKVGLIYFIHGTYAGDDPFGIANLIEQINHDFTPIVKEFIKQNMIDKMMEDCGNYTQEYVALFKKAIGNDICCERFIWSSENHHFARLRESIKLVSALANDIDTKMPSWGERVLLFGHSHAGQLFALMTNFLAQSPGVSALLAIGGKAGIDVSKFDEYLQKIRQVHLDIVTFGTPPRYGWGDGKYNLLNIINHRGNEFLAGAIDTMVFSTKHGDYVQQSAIAGSDTIAKTDTERMSDKKLDEILGKGNDMIGLFENLKARMRVPHYGKTILVDYKDNSTIYPNCFDTLFGHGVYTRYEKMLFNTQLIVDEMY